MAAFSFRLRLGQDDLEIRGDLPEPGAPASEMVPAYLGIGEVLLEASGKASGEEGKTPSCGPGCGACCKQLVPISRSEADYLRKIVIPGLEDGHRGRVEARIAQAAEKLESAGMAADLGALPSEQDRVKRQNLGLRYFFLGISCPFLEEDSCSIHPQRPLACREYLVTSPASRCASPSAGDIVPIVPKVKPSGALIRTDRHTIGTEGWTPMITALTATETPDERQVTDPQAELGFFLSQLGRD
jgi:Fe-S-cluster containining protein